jgi:hypothetical protein
MATKNGKVQETNGLMSFSRKAALAYVGAFGVAADELGKLFELFVTRGERIEKDARKLVKQNSKQVREFAQEVRQEQKVAATRANKAVKKAVKRVENAIA